MANLNEILYKVVNGMYPVIQLSNGLYTPVVAIHPSEESGTNLQITYKKFNELDQMNEVTVTVIGSWNSNLYYYNSDYGTWGKDSGGPV